MAFPYDWSLTWVPLRLLNIGPDIYFHQRNADEHHAALELRDAVLRLRRDGAFIAVPLFRVNTDPIGPHPVGKLSVYAIEDV